MRPHGKRTSLSPSAPSAWFECDRCGMRGDRREARWQYEWGGTQLINLRLLVHEHCLDKPQAQLRAKIIGPDPLPILNPRPENETAQDTSLTVAGLGINVPQPLAVFLSDDPARQYDTLGLVRGASAGYGLRQINLGYRGAAIQVRNAQSGLLSDIGFLNYGFDVARAQYVAGKQPLTISIWYDQSGYGNHLVQSDPEQQPTLVLNNGNGPAVLFSGSQQMVSLAALDQAQPFSFGAVARTAGGSSAPQTLIATTTASPLLGFSGGNAVITDTTSLTLASAPAVAHALMGIFNGPVSSINQDGATVAGNPGSDAASGFLVLGSSLNAAFFTGLISEAYVWPIALSTTQVATVNNIAHKVYGF